MHRIQHIVLSALVFSLVLAVGCSENTVDKDQPTDAFIGDVKAELAKLNQRSDNLKQRKDALTTADATRVENATEMAEEKMETIRDSSLPALAEATDPDQVESLKEQINNTLSEVKSELDRARDIIDEQTATDTSFLDERKEELAGLKAKLDKLRSRKDDLADSAKAQMNQSLESAEEAIDQASSSLGKFKDAAGDQAEQMKEEIDMLVGKARDQVNTAAEYVAEQTE